jgi:hypothetical protein
MAAPDAMLLLRDDTLFDNKISIDVRFAGHKNSVGVPGAFIEDLTLDLARSFYLRMVLPDKHSYNRPPLWGPADRWQQPAS